MLKALRPALFISVCHSVLHFQCSKSRKTRRGTKKEILLNREKFLNYKVLVQFQILFFTNLQVKSEKANLHDKPGVGSDGSLACRIFLEPAQAVKQHIQVTLFRIWPPKSGYIQYTPEVSQFAPEKRRRGTPKGGTVHDSTLPSIIFEGAKC